MLSYLAVIYLVFLVQVYVLLEYFNRVLYVRVKIVLHLCILEYINLLTKFLVLPLQISS